MTSAPQGPSISGDNLAGTWQPGTGAPFSAIAAATGLPLTPTFRQAGPEQLEQATRAAAGAAAAYRQLPRHQRVAFLEKAAEAIDGLGDTLTERVVAETGLPQARAIGERGRTVGQLRLFAEVVREGSFLGARHDVALPERRPLPRPELRLVHIPIGPVAVFGASNFPLAFSVAGGDTASALAAGCPVVVKAHPAHPGVSELVARAMADAATATGMPEGVFAMLHGGPELGQALVRDPRIRAVGFTGSRSAGLALLDVARSRPTPIPVYAEMSSVNPVVILPGAISAPADSQRLAAAYLGSLTKEAGQFCTNPGLLLLPSGPAGDAFLAAVAAAVGGVAAQTMLTAGITQAYAAHLGQWRDTPGVRVVVGADADAAGVTPTVLQTELAVFTSTPALTGEVFGPAGLVVRYGDLDTLAQALADLEGQLTATVHAGSDDLEAARRILPVLEDRAGRLLWGGWPTGVEVAPAMVHGGPWPATSAPMTTSVGTLAIDRWLRPVCYQDLPIALLPPELQP